MKLCDLPIDQELTVIVMIGEQKMEFPSSLQAANQRKKLALLAPIMKEGRILNFNGKGITTSILVQLPESKPMIFHNIILNTMKKNDGGLCYSVQCTCEGVEVNRRGAFRCPIGLRSLMRIGLDKETHDIIIRDVSLTGFSFVFIDLEEATDIGKGIHIVLNDYLENSDENFSFQLYGNVVRIEEVENGKTIYGCKLAEKVRGLDMYIAKKERARMYNQRGK
jgi:hypothetical protein